MSEPRPFTDDELAQARNAPLGWTARRWLATVDALRMADHDELLARVDAWQFDSKRNDFDTWQLLSDLRAALAARPQPDDRLREAREIIDSLLGLIPHALVSDSDREAIRAAVAGSATPTESTP